jgi:parallel beta-helix repeat protein
MKCTFSNGGIVGERSAGFILINTQNGVIFKNNFIGNDGAGIAAIGSLHNVIQKNLCSENGVGIYVEWGMFTTIKQNDCKNNFDSGIVIASAHKNVIEKNDCFENANAGIALINVGEPDHSPKDNIIYKNNLENNLLGIYSSDADMNDVLRNTIAENFYGISFGLGSEGNTVYHNNFIDNDNQAIDFQPTANNWHHPYMLEGNFWSDAPFGYDLYPIVEENGWEVMTPIEEEILDPLLPNRLGGDRIVIASETSYIRYGVLQLFSERVEGEAYPPYTVRINGEEVLDSVWLFKEETDYGEPGLMQLYYIKIPPYYLTEVMGLTLGYHEYLVEISWYNSGELQVASFTTGFTLIE